MEILSILNPPATDILNDPRVTSRALLKMIDDQQASITQRLRETAALVKREDITFFDLMMFTCLQHHLHVTTLNTKLTARQVDLGYMTAQLNLTLERLTKWVIGLTVALAVLAIPLAMEVISKWLEVGVLWSAKFCQGKGRGQIRFL